MQFKHLHTFIAVTLACLLLASCHSKVDLTDINKQAELDLGLAFPVGTMRVTIGDILNAGTFDRIYVDDKDLFHLIDTVDLNPKKYHNINLEEFVLKNSDVTVLPIKPALNGKTSIVGDGSTVTELSFETAISAEHFNVDPLDERVDSIRVDSAKFFAMINEKEFGLKWSEIERIDVELGKQFNRKKSKVISLPFSKYSYAERFSFDVDNFSFCLMKDPRDTREGSIDSVNVRVTFYIRPEDGHTLDVTDNSRFLLDLRIIVDKYEAIWGYFAPGKQMKDEDIIDMNEEWEEWKNIKKLKVRFMEPYFKVFYFHKVAAPLNMVIDYVYAKNAQGETGNATWGSSTSTTFPLQNRLDPDIKTLGDSVCNIQLFNQHPDSGHVDQLFNVRPDYFNYRYRMVLDEKAGWRQHRLERDIMTRGYVAADIPFKIDKQSEAEYSTTLEDVNISSISLDSIVASTEALDSVKTSDVKLIIEVRNGLPFKFTGDFTFLDKNGRNLDLRLIQDSTKNSLVFPAPTIQRGSNEKYGKVTAPSVARYIIAVGKNDFERLAEVKSVRMDVAMLDNPEPCMITTKDYLKVFIGIAARVDAILDLEKSNDNNKK